MAILQAWIYMTNYVNHYATWRWYEFLASWADLVLSMVPVAVGALVIFAFITSPYGFLLGLIVMSAGNFLILLRKHNSNRCVNVIHT
ncbi:MAG: hypothetical protein IJ856_05010 [Candidatus Methanomethylophilaceae archaeon]|nr:hypothetical protein [Candidatus Methanomethylophilaceae archaeon]